MNPVVIRVLKFINKIAFQKVIYSIVFLIFSLLIARIWNDKFYILGLLGVQVIYAILNIKSISIITSNQLTQKDTLKYLYNLPLSKYEAPLIMAYQSLISLTPLLFPLIFYFVLNDMDRDGRIILLGAIAIPVLYLSISFIGFKKRILKNYESGFQQQLSKLERYARNLDIGVKYFVFALIIILTIFITVGVLFFYNYPFRWPISISIILAAIFSVLYYFINIDEREYLKKLKTYKMSKARLISYHVVFVLIFIGIKFQTTKFFRGDDILLALSEKPEEALITLEKNPSLVNYKNSYGVTPLLISIYKADYDLYKELIELGADPKVTQINTGDEYQGMNSLLLAINKNSLKIVQDLIITQNVNPLVKYKKYDNYALNLTITDCRNYPILAFILGIKSLSNFHKKTLNGYTILNDTLQKGCLLNAIVIGKYMKQAMPKELDQYINIARTLSVIPENIQQFIYHMEEL